MCDINCIWLFKLLVAVVLITLQQQQHVVCSKQQHQQHQQQEQQLYKYQYASPYDGISSYAASNAANYLHRTTTFHQPYKVVKRNTRSVKNTDFISFLNDFNIQEETSIPEDIIDQQHLQEIIDKQQQNQQQQEKHLQQKYAGDNSATGSGVVLNGNGDIIDVNLPYDNDSTNADTDGDGDAADIILESQRSNEQSDGNSNSKNLKKNNNNNDDSEEELVLEENTEIDEDMKNKNFKRTYNKKELFTAGKTLKIAKDKNNKKYLIDIKNQQATGKLLKQNNIGGLTNQYGGRIYELESNGESDDNEDDDDIIEDKFELDEVDDNDDDDDDDGSAEYERFKKQREIKQQQQHMTTLKTIINAIPDSHEEEIVNNNGDNDKDKIKHNGNYAATAVADDNNRRNNQDYEIFRKHLEEEQQKLLKLQQKQQPKKEDAIGDIDVVDNENSSNLKASNNNKNNNNNKNTNDNIEQNVANIFIPRKMKRHNGAARLDDATNRYARLKEDHEENLRKSHINSDTDEQTRTHADNYQTDAVAKVSTQEEDFKKKYFDILKENSTSASAMGGHHLQYHRRSGDDSNLKDFNFHDDFTEKEEKSALEVKKQQQQTAFEKEKSLRRSNKRYGHKTHKKKYKDYLRYSQILMMTTPSTSTSAPTTNVRTSIKKSFKDNHDKYDEDRVDELNVLRDKHLKKLKLEKIKSLIPSAPIFILKQREKEHEKEEQLKTEAKIEEATVKPFYEGQINYFLETPDDDSERANEVRFITKGERIDTNDWYHKLSPVLRNGNKKLSSTGEERSSGTTMGGSRSRAGYTPYHHYRPRQHSHGQTRNHHYHQQHHHQVQHNPQAHHHQMNKHSRHHAYQRKMIPKRLMTTTTPLPHPSRKQVANQNGIGEMGHQITDIKDLDRYYAKWPHLAKVQSQLHEEQMREQQQAENYPDYEYDSDDYFEEDNNKDENLPPYIRKFNRRNKQLLDLLEGTIAPPTKPSLQLRWAGSKVQSLPKDTSVGSMSVRVDDDYLKEKRKRYHQRQKQIHDLFAQQRTSTTTQSPPPYPYVNTKAAGTEGDHVLTPPLHTDNHLPDEDVSISLESTESDNDYNNPSSSNSNVKTESANDNGEENNSNDDQEIWQKEIETKSANIANDNLPAANWQTSAAVVATKKSALHKLPSYPSVAGGYFNRPRSRSAQFAPSSGSEYRTRVPLPYLNSNNDNMINNHNNFINAGGFAAAYNNNKAPDVSKNINGRFSANTPNDYNRHQQTLTAATTTTNSNSNTTITTPIEPESQSSSSSSSNSNINNHSSLSSAISSSAAPSSVTNSFIYHRVVDASPRLVGAGYIAGRKQRLPFVAITDRRLETSKKSLMDHQKDFEQNHYPLP